MSAYLHRVRGRAGFTLVEAGVTIIIVGVLAAFAVPRLMDTVERKRAVEAFDYLKTVRTAQERYQQRQGTFTDDIRKLDVQAPSPQYFTASAAAPGTSSSLQDSWSLTLTRTGSPGGYGAYTVTFTEQGYDSSNSTIPDTINPMRK